MPYLGLHVDTNNGKPFRFATAIMYLNDTGPGGGGETVFPVDDAVAASDDNCYEATLFGERPASAIRTSGRIPRPVRIPRRRLVRRSSGGRTHL